MNGRVAAMAVNAPVAVMGGAVLVCAEGVWGGALRSVVVCVWHGGCANHATTGVRSRRAARARTGCGIDLLVYGVVG